MNLPKNTSCEIREGVAPNFAFPISQNAKRSLFIPKGITLHPYINNSEIVKEYPLLKCLYDLGYPVKSLNSMIQCGQEKDFIVIRCGCGERVVPLTHHCDLRTCPICSLRRKKRLRKRFLPFLKTCKIDNKNDLYFLTISPKNYNDLTAGLEETKKDFNKWRRHQYIQERVKAGFFVIEAKEKENGTWNIHLHIVVYGRRLDNRIRGRCLECGQNLISYNKEIKKYFCSNKNCNSMNVVVKEHSILNQLWIKSTGHEAHFHITNLKSASSTLNYMLKYISTNKEDFQSVQGEAKYIMAIRGKRLVSSFGDFYKVKLPKLSEIPKICPHCNQIIEFIYDSELVCRLSHEYDPPQTSYQKTYTDEPIQVIELSNIISYAREFDEMMKDIL